jgi:hypothetical protein
MDFQYYYNTNSFRSRICGIKILFTVLKCLCQEPIMNSKSKMKARLLRKTTNDEILKRQHKMLLAGIVC